MMRLRCRCMETMFGAFLALLVSPVASTVVAPGLLRVSRELEETPSFPNSETVLDMIMLSNAVYHLKNKVTSCQDPQAGDEAVIMSTRQEIINAFMSDEAEGDSAYYQQYLRRLDGNTQESQNLFDILLPEGVICLHYSHDYSLGTQVLVVRSLAHKYVSIVYAGTDDFTTALMDGEILMSKFGPTNNNTSSGEEESSNKSELEKLLEQVPEEAHVHHGFNNAVFDSVYFPELLECISSARLGGSCDGADDRQAGQTMAELAGSEPFQLYTTGHSLGAADSILLGATLHLTYPTDNIQSINFGCPKIGNVELSYWIDSLRPDQRNSDYGGSFEVFRFVNKLDIVPRLPDLLFFQHAGHTLQMSAGGAIRAYYNHWGDEDLGYAGVPFGWGAEPYLLFPVAIYAHHHTHYLEYLQDYAPKSNTTMTQHDAFYFVTDFEHVDENERTETGPSPVNLIE